MYNYIDSSRPSGRVLENQKTGTSRDLFLPEGNFKASSAVSFPKNIQIFEVWKQNKDMKLRLEFFFFTCLSTYAYELNVI